MIRGIVRWFQGLWNMFQPRSVTGELLYRYQYETECYRARTCGVTHAELSSARTIGVPYGFYYYKDTRGETLLVHCLWCLAAVGIPETRRIPVLLGIMRRYHDVFGTPIPMDSMEHVVDALVHITARGKASMEDLRQLAQEFPQFASGLGWYRLHAPTTEHTAESVLKWILGNAPYQPLANSAPTP